MDSPQAWIEIKGTCITINMVISTISYNLTEIWSLTA